MDALWREKKWKHKPKELYPDVSCKDASVPAALLVPNCDCGKPAEVTQSMHPDTAARAHYMCGDYRAEEMCNFFQWIDGPEMVDTRILHFKRWGTKPYERFKRWVPPPPNPPPMTAEEKKEAIARRRANPPLCKCGVPAEIHRATEGSPYTPTFSCRNRSKNGYPLCDFSEYDYGPKSYWPDVTKKEKEKVRYIAPDTMCHCGVKANFGLVPSELGVGYYCGHMVGDDLTTRKCEFEFYWEKKEVDREIEKRRRFGIHPEVLNSYVRNRKEAQRKLAREMGTWPRSGVDRNKTSVSTLFQRWQKTRKRRADNGDGEGLDEAAKKVQEETMKALVANLPIVPEKDE